MLRGVHYRVLGMRGGRYGDGGRVVIPKLAVEGHASEGMKGIRLGSVGNLLIG